MMEFPDPEDQVQDLESSLIGDSEVPVDFLHDIQNNISNFQTLLEKLSSRVEQLENTTSMHSKTCICMNKSVQQQQPSTSAPSGLSSKPPQHPEIARIDFNVNALNSKFESLRNDLKELATSINELKGEPAAHSDKNSGAAMSSSSVNASSATASKLLLNQRKPQLAAASASADTVRPRPPLLIRAPSTAAGNNAAGTSLLKMTDKQQGQAQQPKPEANFDNESDEDENMSDEYEGEEENVGVGGNADEEHDNDNDDTFMQIQPEVILYDEDDDHDQPGGPNFGGQDDDDDLGDQDDFDDGMPFELGGFGGDEDEGPMVEIEFRDKLGNIVQCLAYEQTGKIKCSICDVQCMSRRNIIRHYNNKHADPKYYECSICGAILNRKDSLTVHLRNQHNIIEQGGSLVLAPPSEAPPLEPIASSSASTTSTSTSGTPTPKSSSGIQYSCNSCGKSFSRPDALTSHSCAASSSSSSNGLASTAMPKLKAVLPVPVSTRPKLIPKLPKQEPQSLLDPVIAKKCPLCPKTFTVRSYLVRHLKAHTQNNQCVACGKTYSRRDKLRAHQRKHHGQVLDDNYIDQNLNMNRTHDDGDGEAVEGEGLGLGLGDVDLDLDLEAGESLLNTPMWAYS